MNAAKPIIAKFGGQSALAAALGTKQSTVQHWAKTGTIPAKWHTPIASSAVDRGISLSPGEFSPLAVAGSTALAAPVARWPGLLPVGEDELPCYVLEDGRSVITRTGALNFLTGGRAAATLRATCGFKMLQPFLPGDLEASVFRYFDSQGRQQERPSNVGLGIYRHLPRLCPSARHRSAYVRIKRQSPSDHRRFSPPSPRRALRRLFTKPPDIEFERAPDALTNKAQAVLGGGNAAVGKDVPNELWIQFGRLTNWRGPIHAPKYWGKLVNELV